MAEETLLKSPNNLNLSAQEVAGGAAAVVATKANKTMHDGLHFIHTAEAVRTGAAAHHTIHGLHSFGSTFFSSISGFMGIFAGGVVSAYINHVVHGHYEKRILEHYRPQIAAWQGKDNPESATVEDLREVAQEIPGLEDELRRSRGMRNVRTGAVVLASVVAFAAVIAAGGTVLAPLATGALISWSGAGFVAASMVVSVAVLGAATKGFIALGKKLFGYNKPNLEDHVNGLDELVKENRLLSPEQVMGVYVAANPDLQTQIQETFGDRYEALTHAQQVKAEQVFGKDLPLKKLTNAINSGEMDPRELMFVVHGKPSSPAVVELLLSAKEKQPQDATQLQPESPEPDSTKWRDLENNRKENRSEYTLAV